MSTEKTGGAAFPTLTGEVNGMTLLDYFAAKFATAEMGYPSTLSLEQRILNTSNLAYKKAAAMIEERKKYINQ